MKFVLQCCFLLVLAAEASAHRLDEYLQATRIAVATNRIDLFIELTPGVAVAGTVMAIIDTDHDGAVSKEEEAVYARRMLKDLSLVLDGKTLAVSEVNASVPTLSEMNAGLGAILIQAAASITPLTEGNHTLNLTNAHMPTISVYLVNALVPKDPSLKVTKQVRDETQTDYRLEFESASPLPLLPAAGHAANRDLVLHTMKRATEFMVQNVSREGGYVWNYLPDFSRTWGEMEAYPTMIWLQLPGTPGMGSVFLNAYRATDDEDYCKAASQAADALIRAQHPSGGMELRGGLCRRGFAPKMVPHDWQERMAVGGVSALLWQCHLR